MTELDGLIQYWKAMLETRYLLSPAVITHIENTIKYLEKLRSKD